MGDLRKDHEVGDDNRSPEKITVGGKNVVLKVERDENFVMPSRVNPCLKYSIFTFSYLLLFFSIGLVTLGIWAQTAKSGVFFSLKKFDSKNIALFLDPTIFIISTGIIIIIISFCGAVG